MGCVGPFFFATLHGVAAPTATRDDLGAASSLRAFALDELRRDFDQLHAVIVGRHPLLHTNRTELDEVAARQRAALREGMTEWDFHRLLRPVVRATNCGHAELAFSDETGKWIQRESRHLPLAIRVIRGRLHVLRALPETAVPAGAELRRIDGRPAAEILAHLCDGIPGDGVNVTRKINFINERFHEWYSLLISSAERFTVEYTSPGSSEMTVAHLEGVTREEWSPLEEPVRDRGEVGDFAFEATHAWLRVNSFMFYKPEERARFRRFIGEFFAELAMRKIPSLILDLRGNGGGDPYCGADLFAHLIDRPLVYFAESGAYYPELKLRLPPAANAFTGRLILLIDGGVFSTTGHVCSLLKYHRIGTFLGEETGGSFACTANSHSEVLEHTRLRLSNATTVFRTAVQGLPAGRGVMPDQRVTPDLDDLLAHRDPVLAAAVALVRLGD